MRVEEKTSLECFIRLFRKGKLDFSKMTEEELDAVLDLAGRSLEADQQDSDAADLAEAAAEALSRFSACQEPFDYDGVLNRVLAAIPSAKPKPVRRLHPKRCIRRVVSIAATFVILASLTVMVFGSAFKYVDISVDRSEDKLIVNVEGALHGREFLVGYGGDKEYTDQAEFLADNQGISFPTYIPEEYEFDTASRQKWDGVVIYAEVFMHRVTGRTLTYKTSEFFGGNFAMTEYFFVDGVLSEEWDEGGTHYLLESNEDIYSSVWYNDNFIRGLVGGPLPLEEFRKVIQSVEGG